MKTEVQPALSEYTNQRDKVRLAMKRFADDEQIPIAASGFTGNHLFVAERNEWWFETWVRWNDGVRYLRSWSHVYLDLAEFDLRFGSPDHPDTFGYRECEGIQEALEGKYD